MAGGVVALASFKDEFNLASSTVVYAEASSNIIALLNAGAFFGTFIPPMLNKFLGRKMLLAIAGFFFLVGGILQVCASGPTLVLIYAGRIITGLGVGVISNVAPVFVAEAAPKHLRGIMVRQIFYYTSHSCNTGGEFYSRNGNQMSLFELFLVSGGMLAYWTTYGCSVHLHSNAAQWRTPLSLQIILAALVIITTFAIPESPRWLAKQDKYAEATKSLCHLRNATPDSAEISAEMAEIRAQICEEMAQTQGRTIRELFEGRNLARLMWALGVGLFAMQVIRKPIQTTISKLTSQQVVRS